MKTFLVNVNSNHLIIIKLELLPCMILICKAKIYKHELCSCCILCRIQIIEEDLKDLDY